MKKEFNKNRVGLSLGYLFGTMHFLWVIIVAIGLGSSTTSLLTKTHFIEKTISIAQLNFVVTILGIIGAFVSGYVIGWLFAWIYNKLS